MLFAFKVSLREFFRFNARRKLSPLPPPGSMYNSRSSNLLKIRQSELIKNSNILETLPLLKSFLSLRDESAPGAFGLELDDIIYYLAVVNILQPASILELGSGTSTAAFIFHQALSSRHLRFTTLDGSSFWLNSTKSAILKTLSQNELAHENIQMNFVDSPIVEYSYNKFNCLGYEKFPNLMQDFIFIDGPPLTSDRQACLDPLLHGVVNEQTVLMVDGRNTNSQVLYNSLYKTDNNWKRYLMAFPSDDSLFINTRHVSYEKFMVNFENCITEKLL